MVDIVNLLGTVTGLTQQFQAASITQAGAEAQAQSIRVGGEIAAQGAALTAAGFRESAEGVRRATAFNLEIQGVNLHRQLQKTSRQMQRLLGRQITQQASSGLAIGSKSFLQLRNESLDTFNNAMLQLKVDTENRRRAQLFESQVKQVNLENQARAADYRAAAERVLASNRAAEAAFQGELAQFKATKSAIGAVPTLLSQVFQS